ncbi:cation channel sperm-associated protein 3 isoform X3 [Macrotis lagotis]|uniref:cation channel sperm-associated protein 3 isoform X3 n=1 Tax=Macrotis lagotis TaxID=92651 RepID=UPI003D69AF85
MERFPVFFSRDRMKKISSSLFNLTSLRIWEKIGKFKRKDSECCAYVKRFIEGRFFSILMISVISVNALCMVLQTNYVIKYQLFLFFEILEVLFMSIYCFEFGIKFYVDPIGYWKNGYNVLDVIIIIILSLPFCLRKLFGRHYPYLNIAEGIQSLQILKLIPYSRGIKVDGWTSLQYELDKRAFILSRAFTIFFILLGSFVFLSMFVGVMIIHTEDSMKKFEKELENERHMSLIQEKQNILKKQQEDVSKLMRKGTASEFKSFSEMVEGFKKTLRHTDPMVLDDFCTTIPFIDIYLTTLDNQDNTIFKLQGLYYEMVNVLNQMLEDMPVKKHSVSSERSEDYNL